MEHLIYEDYQQFGGKVGPDDFPLLLIDCERYLEYVTMSRIDKLDDSVKRLEVKIIDEVLHPRMEVNPNVSSFSDGIDSFSYVTQTQRDINRTVFELCKQFLPDEFLFRGVSNDC